MSNLPEFQLMKSINYKIVLAYAKGRLSITIINIFRWSSFSYQKFWLELILKICCKLKYELRKVQDEM